MDTNLNSDYVKFIQSGRSLGFLAQEVIDRIQYTPGFLDEVKTLVNKYESPFEDLPIRKLKPHYLKPKN